MIGQNTRRYGIAIIIGTLALLGIVLAVVLNLWTPTKFPGAMSFEPGCVCSGVSFTFKFPPPLPGEGQPFLFKISIKIT